MSGQNYIGSKISLISLSDIRYVGTLHSINTNDSTVSLENVRSFGTEGRRGSADDEVPASDTVFDFVVFRGSDIKDLQVFEAPSKPAPPPPQQHTQGMVDPAISHSVKGYPPMNPYMMPNYPPHQAMYWQTPMYPGQQMPLGQPPMPSSNQQPPPPQPTNISPSSSVPVPPTNMSQPAPTPSTNNELQQSQPQQQQSVANTTTAVINSLTEQLNQDEIDGAAVENLAKQVSELDVDSTEPEENGSLPQQQSQQQSHQRQNNNNNNYRGTRNNNNNNNYRQNNSSHTNGTRNQTGKQQQQQRINIPQSDFDFESSNAKFSKNELLKELMGGSKEETEANITNTETKEETVIIPPNDEEFYDKNKSFFDNISCESKERQDQEINPDRRGKFHEERRLNMETFGQASVDQTRYRNFRGRGGHRGGYRGNRGGNNNYRGGNRNHSHNNRNNYGYRSQHQHQHQQQPQQPQQQQQQVESQ